MLELSRPGPSTRPTQPSAAWSWMTWAPMASAPFPQSMGSSGRSAPRVEGAGDGEGLHRRAGLEGVGDGAVAQLARRARGVRVEGRRGSPARAPRRCAGRGRPPSRRARASPCTAARERPLGGELEPLVDASARPGRPRARARRDGRAGEHDPARRRRGARAPSRASPRSTSSRPSSTPSSPSPSSPTTPRSWLGELAPSGSSGGSPGRGAMPRSFPAFTTFSTALAACGETRRAIQTKRRP